MLRDSIGHSHRSSKGPLEAEFTSAHSVGDEENPEKKSASQSAVTPST
jgi:hypothetical protein